MQVLGSFRLLLPTLLAYIAHVTDGCGRTPARTKPPPTTPAPTPSTPHPQAGSTRGQSHRLVCSVDEVKQAACLHGGTCFALELLDTRSPHCHCEKWFTGLRCEELDDKFYDLVEWMPAHSPIQKNVFSADKVVTAGIAAGVVAVIIILTVIIVYLIIKKRKARKQRAERNAETNGHARKLLINKDGILFESPVEGGNVPEKSETNV